MVAASTSAADAPDLTEGGTVFAGGIELPFTAAGNETFWFRLKRPANLPTSSIGWSYNLVMSGVFGQRNYIVGGYQAFTDDPVDTSGFDDPGTTGLYSAQGNEPRSVEWVYYSFAEAVPQDRTELISWDAGDLYRQRAVGSTVVTADASIAFTNDYFVNRAVLPLEAPDWNPGNWGAYNGSTSGYTFETGEHDLTGFDSAHSAWFEMPVPIAGNYTIFTLDPNTTPTLRAAKMSIYTAPTDTPTITDLVVFTESGDDQADSIGTIQINADFPVGTYYVQLFGFADDGNYILRYPAFPGSGDVDLTPEPCTGGTSVTAAMHLTLPPVEIDLEPEVAAGATAVTAELSLQVASNDNFADRHVLTGDTGTVHGTTTDFTTETDEVTQTDNGQGPATAWFQWSPSVDGYYIFHTLGVSGGLDLAGTYVAIYTARVPDPGLADLIEYVHNTVSNSPYADVAYLKQFFHSDTTYYIQLYSTFTDQPWDDEGRYELSYAPGGTWVGFAVPDPVLGSTEVTVALGPEAPGWSVDDVTGSTTVTVGLASDLHFTPDLVAATATVRVIVVPDMSDADPITLAFDAHAEMQLSPPEDPPDVGHTPLRVTPLVAFDIDEPIIVKGKPVVPLYWAKLASSTTAIQGAKHIHAEDPAPVYDPTHNNFTTPPPDAPPWTGRWVVDDLPDPPTDGYYWLGDATYLDGTAGYTGGRTKWAAHASTPHAPAWKSFFPYKPSVRAFDSYLPNGDVIHHPKGVHFNSQYVEHMWAEFDGPRRQPFTWVITGMIVSFPTQDYVHYILDAGRNPDKVGFPRLSASDVYNAHSINDNLNYRSLIAYGRHRQTLQSSGKLGGDAHSVRARVVPNTRPKMFFGVFNGDKSVTGAYSPHARDHHTGRIANGDDQRHRFYVLGRGQSHISQQAASHMLIFEVRYWRDALTLDEIEQQYKQLSSSYKFDKYKAV